MSEEFYTVEHAARRLGLHPKTVLRFIREDRLRATRVGRSWRILRSDLDVFAGVPRAEPTIEAARATCVLEIPNLSPERAGRLMDTVQGAVNSRSARPSPVQITTAYDPAGHQLKVVIIASPGDSAALLQLLSAWLDGAR
jgi:excisionase family DNA binding protein